MTIRLTVGQLNRLSTLFLNLAQGAFLAIIAFPLFVEKSVTLDSIKSLALGVIFTYVSLRLERWREEVASK